MRGKEGVSLVELDFNPKSDGVAGAQEAVWERQAKLIWPGSTVEFDFCDGKGQIWVKRYTRSHKRARTLFAIKGSPGFIKTVFSSVLALRCAQ